MAPRRFEELSATGGSVPALDRVEVVPLEPKLSAKPIWQVVRPRRSAQRLKLLTETQQLQRKSHGATEVANTAGSLEACTSSVKARHVTKSTARNQELQHLQSTAYN